MPLLRYPNIVQQDIGMLQSPKTPYANHRQATDVHHHTVFLTYHTILFVLNGHKRIHFPSHTQIMDGSGILVLRRGVYLMSEFIPEGLQYEALLLFFTDKALKEFLMQFYPNYINPNRSGQEPVSHVLVPTDSMLESFKRHYMGYFNSTLHPLEPILQTKLQELFLLLTSGPYKHQVMELFQQIAQDLPIDLDFVVRKHLFQDLTMAELAKLSGRSLATFKRDFQAHYQSAPRKWINEQRLAHAYTLLHSTDKTISEIAHACGFESVPHFIKIFKREYKTTPQSMRTKTVIL